MTKHSIGKSAGYRLMTTLGLLLLLAVPQSFAAEFVIEDASIRLDDEAYLLDATIDYRFNDTALEALRSGVPLTLEVRIEVYRIRPVLWNERVATLRLRYQLRYRALSRLYQVVDINSGTTRSFASITAAIRALGTIRNLVAIERHLLEPDERYLVRLRANLDIEALPLPLRPLAYVSPSWHLASEWFQWQPGS